MPEMYLNVLKRLQILFLFSLFLLPEAVAAQSGLINSMTFEDAEAIAIKSVRRASGIKVKEIDFKSIKTNAHLLEMVKKDKYARNCLPLERLNKIQKNGTKEPETELDKEFKEEIETELNDNCFPYKRLRLTDSLDFLGITDEFRLAALRSYIVRNVEFGVKSIWGKNPKEVAQSFVISGKQLEDVTTATTVLELAKKIQSSAAVPFLTYDSADKIVKNCRNKVTGNKEELKFSENITIFKDLSDSKSAGTESQKVEKFAECINFYILEKSDVKNVSFEKEDKDEKYEDDVDRNPARSPANLKLQKYGVQSIRIVDNEGDNRFYYLTAKFDEDLKKIETNNWTYKTLLENLVNSAGISSPAKFVAMNLVMNALFKAKPEEAEKAKTSDTNPSKEFTTFNISRFLQSLPLKDDPITLDNTLRSLNVDAAVLIEKIEAQSQNGSYFLLDETTKKLKPIAKVKLERSCSETEKSCITDGSSLKKIINVVKKKITQNPNAQEENQ